jgi:hypothetical protein
MPATKFDRDSMARWYAQEHINTDPGIRSVHYLPTEASPQEIRLIEVNDLIGDLDDSSLEPLDFGVDRGTEDEHTLWVLDVTPRQWESICDSSLPLPQGWSLEGAVEIPPRRGSH